MPALEVSQVRIAVLTQQDVLRLDVTMDQACRVCRVECVSNRLEDAQRGVRRESSVPDPLAERRALHEPHREERMPVHLARVVNGHDVRMVERGDVLSLAPEPFTEVLIRDQLC